MLNHRIGAAVAACLFLPVASAAAADAPVTPAGFRVKPAGLEIGVSKVGSGFQGPLGSAVSSDGRRLLSASSGAARYESADLFNLDDGYRASSVPYDAQAGQSAFYDAVFAPGDKTAYVSGGGQGVLHQFAVDGDGLREVGTVAAGPWPAGLAYGTTPRGSRLYVANNLSSNPVGPINPPGHTVTVLDPRTNEIVNTIDLGTPLQPLGVTFDRTGAKAYVTQWMGRAVAAIDTATETKVADISLGDDALRADHPSAIAANPRRDEVYTANAARTPSRSSTRPPTASPPRSASASSRAGRRAPRPTGSPPRRTARACTSPWPGRTPSPWSTSRRARSSASSRRPGTRPTWTWHRTASA